MGKCCSKVEAIPEFVKPELGSHQRSDAFGQRKLSVISLGPGSVDALAYQTFAGEDGKATRGGKPILLAARTTPGSHVLKRNQDEFLLLRDLDGLSIVGLFDGHGVFGHLVASFVKKFFTENVEPKKLLEDGQAHITSLFSKCQAALQASDIDVRTSGASALLVVIFPEHLLCASVGDCRVTLGFKDSKGKIRPKDLTKEHRPTDPDELARISSAKGRVQPYMENGKDIGPPRVWIADVDAPGLATSRCLGNLTAQYAGCSAQPTISIHESDAADNFLVLGTNGVFDVLQSREVVSMVGAQPTPKEAASFVSQEASKRWVQDHTDSDDITVVVVYFIEPVF